MGRDFTPRELLASEAVLGDLFEVQRNLIITIDGKEFPYYDKEELAHREQFPILGKLLNKQGFDPLYASASAVPGGMEFLFAVDKELQEYIATGKGDRDSEVIRWFEGTLFLLTALLSSPVSLRSIYMIIITTVSTRYARSKQGFLQKK